MRTLDRTTNAPGRWRTAPRPSSRRVDAGYRFQAVDGGARRRSRFAEQGIGVPTLGSGPRALPWRAAHHRAESGARRSSRAKRSSRDRRAGALERVALGSFSGERCTPRVSSQPGVRTGAGREETRWALYRSWVRWPLAGRRIRSSRCRSGPEATTVVTRRFVEHAHRAGVAVKVWTSTRSADMHRLLDWGVDGLISDRPGHRGRRWSTRERRGGREPRLDVHRHGGQPVEHLLHLGPHRRRACRSSPSPWRSCLPPAAS